MAKELEDAKTKDKTPEVDVTALVEGFKDTMKETVETLAAANQAPAIPVGPTPEETAAKTKAAQESYDAARTKANEMSADGDVAGAFETLYLEAQKMSQATAVPTGGASPEIKAVIASAKRTVKADHKEMFEKYGDEIEKDMATAPPAEQMNPDLWDAAVNRAKAAHIDEIVAAGITQAQEDAEEARGAADFNTPVAGGGGRRRTRDAATVEASTLNADQLEIASACGLDADGYADALTRYKKAPLNKQGNVPILDEDAHPRIKPGQF